MVFGVFIKGELCNECRNFINNLEGETWVNDEYRCEMLIAAEGIMVIAELIAKSENYQNVRYTDTKAWLKKYRQKWVQKNKESELSAIESMFMYFEK